MNRLQELRESHGLQQQEFCAQFGIKPNTYSNYENGQTEPKIAFWKAVADKYQVSIDYLLDFTDNPKGTKYGGKSKIEERYCALDPHGKKLVDTILDLEEARLAAKPDVIQPEPKQPKTRVIPLFPAAAGPGEPSDTSVFDDYEIPIDKKADFAVRISGDSMEPDFKHGDIVFCTKRYPDIGEIAAVMVNGFLVVKQFITDGRNIYLRSLNRKRKDLDMDIWASGSDTVKCYGTVIHKKIPLVME